MSGAARVGRDQAATTVYQVRDASGQLVAEHVREDRRDGSKECKWRRPSGEWGLHGIRLEELPLYGSERLGDWPEEYPVVLVEGEKAADALNRVGHILAVGTVTGAGQTPGSAALEVLRGREVILWHDSDGPGRTHMERTAERLRGVAATVRLYTWHDAPEVWVEDKDGNPKLKAQDAADHPAVLSGGEKALGILLNDLLGAPEWHPAQPAGDSPPPAPNGRGGARGPERFNLTDMGNAERLVARHGRDVRFCYPWAKWLVWTGARWERDEAGRVHRLAKETVRSIYREAAAAEDEGVRKALAQHATRSEAEAKIKAMLELAKSEVPVSPDELDADPWLLNAPNGTIDLRTGELQPHRREDLLMKMAGAEYQPDAPAPAWAAFLERVLPGEELRGFVRRMIGYSLTGDVSGQVLPFMYGSGANGKSTLINAVMETLGDYAQQAAPEILTAKKGSHPTELADLRGARFVASVEVEDGRRLAESLVKQLTGGDRIKARFMRADFFEFEPTHKVFLAANHKPEIRGTDHAIWRRIKLIPFEVTIPDAEKDAQLSEKLREALPGILAWSVRGCLEWQKNGLGEPAEVRKATQEYRDEMDVLAAFFEERCVVSSDAWAAATPLYQEYVSWSKEAGEGEETQRRFGTRLKERGYESFIISSGPHKARKGWRGIGLRVDLPGPGGGSEDPGPAPKPRDGGDYGKETAEGVDDRQLNESGLDMGESSDRSITSRPSRPKNDINNKESSSRGAYAEKRSTSSTSSTSDEKRPPGTAMRRLTEDEARQVQKLIGEGMSPAFARAEVLGESGAA